MKKKIFGWSLLVFVLTVSMVYLQYGNLSADDKNPDGKDCSSECTKKTDAGLKSSGAEMDDDIEYAVYEFTTEKVSCNGSKTSMESSVLGIAGVKKVEFGETCNTSHKTNVKVFYSAGETSEDNLKTELVNYNADNVEKKSGCSKDSKESGASNKSGKDCEKECSSKKKTNKQDS